MSNGTKQILVRGGLLLALGLGTSCIGDAAAEEAAADAAACGSCTGPITVAGEVTLAQPVKMKTADTDASRFVGGSLSPTLQGESLADGPLILTDVALVDNRAPESLAVESAWTEFYVVAPGKDCASLDRRLVASATLNHSGDLHGGRLVVQSGETLCVRQQVAGGFSPVALVVSWSGFRPYE